MRYLLMFICLYQCFSVAGQKHDHFWLMGQNSPMTPEHSGTVIDFNYFPPDIYYEFRDMYFFQTNASICDTAGNLLFYTNGIYIANALGEVMENGEGLNPGDHATLQAESGRGYILDQGAIILPMPENDSIYYLLHMDRVWPTEEGVAHSSKHLYYTVVNINMNGGLGEVIDKNQIILQGVFDKGKLTATRHANGRDWWLIIRDFDSNLYHRIMLSRNYIQYFGSQTMGEVLPSRSIGQATFSPDGTKYVNLQIAGTELEEDYISIYNFDRCTGILSEPIQFTYLDTAWAGGIAISPNSRFLYVSSFVYLYQYDLWAADIEASKDTVAIWDGFNENGFFSTTFYLAQLAPDGKIYINSNNGVSYLHVINQPDLPGDSCEVCQHCVDLPTWNAFSMPNFPNYRLGPLEGSACDTLRQPPVAGFEYAMQGSQVLFEDASYHDIRSWQWQFGDGQTDTVPHPVHQYDTSGSYEVCLSVSNPRGADTLCQTVNVIINGVQEVVAQGMEVYPNPAKDEITILLPSGLEEESLRLTIYDTFGKAILKRVVREPSFNISIRDLANGMYFLKVQSTEKEYVTKVMISH